MYFYGICGLIITVFVFFWMFTTIKESKANGKNNKKVILFSGISGAVLLILSVLLFIDIFILNVICIVLLISIMIALIIVISKIEKSERPVKKLKLKKVGKTKILVEENDKKSKEK